MKRGLLLVFLILALAGGCRKAPAPATTSTPAATTSTPAAAPSGAAGAQPGTSAAQESAQAQAGAQAHAPGPVKPMPAKLPNVVARVNGEPIERWELEHGLKQAEARAGSAVPPDKRDEVLRSVLDQLVAFHIVVQAAKDQRLDVTDSDVEAQMTAIRQSFPTEQAFKQGIAAQGLTLDELRRQTLMSLQIRKVLEAEVNSKVAVSDGEVDAFYKQNLDRFKEGESLHASHILIAVPQTATAAEKEQAKVKAEQILQQIRSGGDFAVLAREHSQDPGTAPKGGDLGFFQKGLMTPSFEKAAFDLKSGTISGVVETPFGFHIIKALERRPARTVPFAEVGPQIKDFLVERQREAKLQQFIEDRKAKTKIEILV
jgi:peptidyl-prolyl cis-trans isomerase C